MNEFDLKDLYNEPLSDGIGEALTDDERIRREPPQSREMAQG